MIVQVSKEKKEDAVAVAVNDISEKIKEKQELRGKKRAKAEQEEEEISEEEKKLKKERLNQVKEAIDNDEVHQEIVRNAVLTAFKYDVKKIAGVIEYSYPFQDLKNGKFENIQRSFDLNFELGDDLRFYLKLAGKKFSKLDVLKLYNAFRTVIKDKMDSLLTNFEKNIHELKEKNKAQLELFADDFREPDLANIPFVIDIQLGHKEEMTELKFQAGKYKGLYSIILNKDNFLTIQDLYFIYSNYDSIINALLNKFPERKEVA